MFGVDERRHNMLRKGSNNTISAGGWQEIRRNEAYEARRYEVVVGESQLRPIRPGDLTSVFIVT